MTNDEIRVLAIPFWRWAVCSTELDSRMFPGFPFYRESSARAFMAKLAVETKGMPLRLVKRSFLSNRYIVVEETTRGERQ